ncbi:MAG: hypothetical protein N2260_10555 [Syntrophobacterales bacterium]|nr:hypothetical protein [Syntrophobacterales bacterium]
MRIEKIAYHPEDELIRRLRNVRLLKKPEVLIYETCLISLERISTDYLFPTQRYVLLQELEKIRNLQWALKEAGYDMFFLNGFLEIWVYGNEVPITLLPPIVEESIEANGSVVILINDGMHRLYLARHQWVIPQVAYIRGIPRKYPYYAYPNPTKWENIQVVDELPPTYIKKWHRIADYHSLYRNFNSAFSSVGEPRGRFSKS